MDKYPDYAVIHDNDVRLIDAVYVCTQTRRVMTRLVNVEGHTVANVSIDEIIRTVPCDYAGREPKPGDLFYVEGEGLKTVWVMSQDVFGKWAVGEDKRKWYSWHDSKRVRRKVEVTDEPNYKKPVEPVYREGDPVVPLPGRPG